DDYRKVQVEARRRQSSDRTNPARRRHRKTQTLCQLLKSNLIDEVFNQSLVAEDKPKSRLEPMSMTRYEQQMRVFRIEEHRCLGLRGTEAHESIHQFLRPFRKVLPVESCSRKTRID